MATIGVRPNTSGFQNQNGFASGNDFFGDNDNWSGNNWNNNNWSSGYQRPSVTYYRPNPTYTTPTYTAPSSVYSGGQVSYSAGVSYASPQVLNDPPVARLPIELEVPKSEFGICNYQLLTPSGRAYDYSITPGRSRSSAIRLGGRSATIRGKPKASRRMTYAAASLTSCERTTRAFGSFT